MSDDTLIKPVHTNAYEKYMAMKAENEKLKNRVRFLENLIKEYTEKMLNNLK